MQGGRLVVPTPGVVNADEVASPVVPAEPAGLVVSGAEPAVVVLRPDVAVGDAVVEPIVESGPITPDVVPIDPLVALPIVLDEPGALVPGDDRELPLSPVPELNVVVEPGELIVPAGEPGSWSRARSCSRQECWSWLPARPRWSPERWKPSARSTFPSRVFRLSGRTAGPRSAARSGS